MTPGLLCTWRVEVEWEPTARGAGGRVRGAGGRRRSGRGAPRPRPAPTAPLLPQLLRQCRLVERILTSWEENDLVQ